jgi:hypothetical protein
MQAVPPEKNLRHGCDRAHAVIRIIPGFDDRPAMSSLAKTAELVHLIAP